MPASSLQLNLKGANHFGEGRSAGILLTIKCEKGNYFGEGRSAGILLKIDCHSSTQYTPDQVQILKIEVKFYLHVIKTKQCGHIISE